MQEKRWLKKKRAEELRKSRIMGESTPKTKGGQLPCPFLRMHPSGVN
jgi:hypothetical protein